jgi:hypothetical protein
MDQALAPDRSCRATRRDGQPCQARALPGSPHCWAHDPACAEQRAEARKRGGRNSAKLVRLRGLVPPRLVSVYDRLEDALGEVHDGTLDPKVGSAMAALARAMVSVLTTGEIEQWVRDLETAAKQSSDRWGT